MKFSAVANQYFGKQLKISVFGLDTYVKFIYNFIVQKSTPTWIGLDQSKTWRYGNELKNMIALGMGDITGSKKL